MRKFILRVFSLNYIFGNYSVLRSATIMFPTFAMYFICDFLKITPLNYIFLGLFILLCLISFVYLKICPIKESEVDLLSENQKLQYKFKTTGVYEPVEKSDNILLLIIPLLSLIAAAICLLCYS